MQNQISTEKKTISIVIPCYNPAGGWYADLLKNTQALNENLSYYAIQYIVSNDGSSKLDQNSVRCLRETANFLFLDHQKNEGKGAAIRKGIAHAVGDIIIYIDIDFPFGIKSVVDIVRIFEKYPDCMFVYGNRTDSYFQNLPVKRKVVSKALHLVNRIFLSPTITDTQAGVKGFRKEISQYVLDTRTNTFVFEVELMRKLVRRRVCIKSIDVTAIPTITFTNFSTRVLFREAVSLSKILFRGATLNILPIRREQP
jgi:glycosyltransferase involved in cell wall biosynthesis